MPGRLRDGEVELKHLASGVSTSAAGSVDAAKLADNAVETAKIKDANVTLAKLAAGITPSHVVKYAGTADYAGGGTSTAITVTGLAATDICVCTVRASTNASYVVKAVATTNTLTVTLSADPGASTKIDYICVRAAA